MQPLTLAALKTEAGEFARQQATIPIPLYGITDGKAVGTYVETAFNEYLALRYAYKSGSAASGIDFPDLNVDLKVTSIRQPQSSCPFRDASQKVFGLGYHLLVFTYEKTDERVSHLCYLKFLNIVFVEREYTADYQTTYGLREILRRHGNKDDIIAFVEERNLPLDEIGRELLADRIISQPPKQGFLTISNALQWRLQYRRIIDLANSGDTEGIENLLIS
ncbi:restriction endonuclease [Laspinema olomoucense]|uniref:restriction endonuclease n=2 Tax=Laspinema olomoucense TaxID=3231600 RepID=UPI0021BB9D9C|nr:restriction endonuclease [Laspinema sp. D3d]MCT7972983.1 restriction endonuclease [Laspinema sp. D3d]